MNTALTPNRLGAALRLGALLMLAALALPVSAAPDFPELSGRVVDNAELLSPAQEQALTERLATEEQQSSNQIVVVTLADLQGYDIADYGVRLGREWGIGQEGTDNGALLLIAPNDRRVRIEVGYGLEGALTDATSSSIIRNDIQPAFRRGDFAGGINAALTSIFAAIQGEYQAPAGGGVDRKEASSLQALLYLIGLVVFTFFLSFGGLGRKGGRRGAAGLMFLPMGMGGFGGGGGGGFGGGGFGGGGGGFGGGGASGGW
ncbi:TPM domain-containing protein [Alloalcanivorax venustensis]|mgnify:CR=1 FL=1|jgi:uncharacterized protein|uniref:TPM domain-containing protein n=1 Tax=Alloalcanivorax venustensis TaxID=172371 RepID=UPI0039E56FE8|nr:TPM domain-containing protein [Alcanivorax sp.]